VQRQSPHNGATLLSLAAWDLHDVRSQILQQNMPAVFMNHLFYDVTTLPPEEFLRVPGLWSACLWQNTTVLQGVAEMTCVKKIFTGTPCHTEQKFEDFSVVGMLLSNLI